MKRNTKVKEIVQSQAVQYSFAAALLVLLLSWLWRWRHNKQAETKTAIGIKGDAEISQSRAHVLAEMLFDAMRSVGTDERTLQSVHDELAKHKKAILQVHEAFATKRYSFYGYDVLGVKLNLRQWLNKELSAKEFAKWDYLYNRATNE